MFTSKLLLALLGLVLILDQCHGATIRDSNGRQINLPEGDGAESDGAGVPAQSQGFLQRIFNMIKNLLGFDTNTRTTIMRSDGTIEEVEVPNGGGGGFISRISKRLLGFINNILSVITGDDGPQLGGYRGAVAPSRVSNEIERELMKMAKNQQS